jgi:hypothetical protein
MELPPLPVKPKEFIPFLSNHPDVPVTEILENSLRSIYAQQTQHPAVFGDPLIDLVPILTATNMSSKFVLET